MARDSTQVYVSYSHRDAASLDRFRAAIRPWEFENKVRVVDDTTIQPGSSWALDLERCIEAADVIVLLVSSDFLSSRLVLDDELPRILERGRRGDAVVVPVILSETLIPPELQSLQALPRGGRPMAAQPNLDTAWAEVADAVGSLATNVQEEDRPKAADAQAARDKELDTRTVVRALKKAGFKVDRRAGAHYILRDDSDPPHTVVLPRQASSIKGGLLRQILRAAEISETEFESLLGGP